MMLNDNWNQSFEYLSYIDRLLSLYAYPTIYNFINKNLLDTTIILKNYFIKSRLNFDNLISRLNENIDYQHNKKYCY